MGGKSANKTLEGKSEGNKERLDKPGDNSGRTQQHRVAYAYGGTS